MPEETATEIVTTPLQELRHALENHDLARVRDAFKDMHPAEIADLLESLPHEERLIAWEMVSLGIAGEVLLHTHDEVREGLIQETEKAELLAATANLDFDDLADLLEDLPDAVSGQLLGSMDVQNRQRLEKVLSYPEDSAGGIMSTDPVLVRADVTLDVVLRYLRFRGQLPEQSDKLVVVDRSNKYLGVLRFNQILINSPEKLVSEVMNRDVDAILVTTPSTEVAKLFEQRDLISAPVVDENDTVIGRIIIDDVVDVIREEAEHSIMSMAGLDDEGDMFAPILSSARRRAVWLGINLGTAFLAAWVIGLFEATLQQIVALAVLMPIVASMGGIAGSQTLTLVIRGLALGHVELSNATILLVKELAVGALNGLIWAVVVGILAIVWFGNPWIGLIIGIAILVNLLCAALAGVIIPLAMRQLGIDPALAGSVVLTTVTDVVGFFAFLGLATLILL